MIAQRVKHLPHKPEDLSQIPRSHTRRREMTSQRGYQVIFIPQVQAWLTQKSINIINHINKTEDKNHMSIQTDI